ncbi:MAG: hypothetical protein EGR83_07670 [Bacteroides cellulosilyticus]|uniref:hypothetical protein n=1 Tax=Bacteroides cellulosilyticus TaxID=246787 RepID=UPI001CCCFD62|nr:hypothetical protein [Bacteroides cellulosilyticus]MBD8981915.1 hypothetical protein [Bacteroides cellulosilyticus]UBD69305.1 hypothetical protein K6V21_23535 [Bacteroides cellulosilyticus]
MKLSRLNLFWGGIVFCTVVTSIYVYTLYCNYSELVAEWNVQAEETFVKALQQEVQKRGNIVVPFVAGVNSPEMKTLESPFQSPVTLTSKYGTHDYEIPRVKFDNSLIKDTEKRMLLSYVLEEHPLNADTLNTSWNSLLIRKSIKANIGIRLSTIDLLKQTSVVCSPDSIKILEGDSLLSRYLGFRCEVEATGFVSYSWWQALEVWPPIIILLLLWLCFFLLFSYYKQITLFLRRKLVKKETVVHIQEKTIVVERKMHLEEVVEQTGLYELADGTILDSIKGVLVNGEKTRQVQPQTIILLKLFLCAKDYRLTAEEMNKKLWEGKGTSSQIHAAIHRLREALKNVSSLIVEKEDKYYCLKMPHFIEKNSTEA